MTLKKIQIAEAIATQLGFPLVRAKALTETFLEIMKRSLESGDDVLISNFGKFCVRDNAERKGRNPFTNEDLMLRPRRVVTFKCVLCDNLINDLLDFFSVSWGFIVQWSNFQGGKWILNGKSPSKIGLEGLLLSWLIL